MQIEVVKSKIHRVTVTGADLNYIGSVTIDEVLMEASNLIEGEKVSIVNINNGERFDTYAIKGNRNSGDIILNGPAARKVHKGDVIIILSYALLEFEEAKKFKPWLVFPNEKDNSFPRIPHPGTVEKSLGQKETRELAVMLDTFKPLHITEAALKIKSDDYYKSWLS